MSKNHVLKLFTAAVVLAASGAASAQLTDVGTFGQNTMSSASSGYTPGRLMKWNNGATFNAYCIDPYTGTSLPGTYTPMTLDSFTNGTTTSGYAGQIARGGYSAFGLSNSANAQMTVQKDIKELFSWAYTDATSGNTAKAAAFGLALWEIILQNGAAVGGNGGTAYSRTTGSFTSTGGDSTSTNFGATAAASTDTVEYWFNSYLTALNGNTWTSLLGGSATQTNWTYTVYYDNVAPVSQTFIRVGPQGVPEPATLALVATALFGVCRFSRRGSKV